MILCQLYAIFDIIENLKQSIKKYVPYYFVTAVCIRITATVSTEKWYVEKGDLVCESGPDKQYGYLSTDKNYKNFELTLEFKQESNGNSGVFFRSGIEGVKISGWQAEVAPLNQHTGGIYESYGRGWLIQPKPEDEKDLEL